MTTSQSKDFGLRFRPGKEVELASVKIHSANLTLIPIEDRFAEDIFREFTAEIVQYMVPVPPRTLDDTLVFVKDSREALRNATEFVLCITDSRSGDFLGCAGLHAKTSSEQPAFGIWLKKGAHGKGFGKEAIHALKHWADEHLLATAYRYPVDRANIPSRKIPESLGGKVVREFIGATHDPERFLDELMYEIPVGPILGPSPSRGSL